MHFPSRVRRWFSRPRRDPSGTSPGRRRRITPPLTPRSDFSGHCVQSGSPLLTPHHGRNGGRSRHLGSRGTCSSSPPSPFQRRPYWSGIDPHPQYGTGPGMSVAARPTCSHGSINFSPTVHRCVQSSPRSNTYRNCCPSLNIDNFVARIGNTVSSSSQSGFGSATRAGRDSNVAPGSNKWNSCRCARSQRANASSIATANRSNECCFDAAKTRHGLGHSDAPRPSTNSTEIDNHVRRVVIAPSCQIVRRS